MKNAIDDYLNILKKTGWHRSHIIQAPMSAQRFTAVVVAAMHKKRIDTGRYRQVCDHFKTRKMNRVCHAST